MSKEQNITGRNCAEHLYRVYALKDNFVIKDLNKKDAKEVTSPGVLIQARDTNGVLLTYNDLVNSADLRKELTGLGPTHFQNLRLERLGEYELVATEQNKMVEQLKDKNAIVDMSKLEDQTLNTFFFKDKEELMAHLTGKKKLRQYSRKNGKEIIPVEYANIPCMFDREIVVVQDGYSLGFVNPLDASDTSLLCPVVGYFEAFKEEIQIKDKRTGKVSTIEVSKEDNSGRVVFCHCVSHNHTEQIIITGRNYRYSAGEVIINNVAGIEVDATEIRISVSLMDSRIKQFNSDKIIVEINGTQTALPVFYDYDTNEIVIDATAAGITYDTNVKIDVQEGAVIGEAETGEEIPSGEKVFTVKTEEEVVLVDPVLEVIREALTPKNPRAGVEYEFDIKYNVTKNDAQSLKVVLLKDGIQIGSDKVVVDGQDEVIHITVPAAESIQGLNKWTVKCIYDLGDQLAKEIQEDVEVAVNGALVNPTMTGLIANLQPASVKAGQEFTFDFNLTVNIGDATDATIIIVDDTGSVVANKDAVDGLNVLSVFDADGKDAGTHTYRARMNYKINGMDGREIEISDTITVAGLIAPTFNDIGEAHTGTIKKGQTFTFDAIATITKNDAENLSIKIMNGSTVVGTIASAVDGANNFTNLSTSFAATGNQTLDVIFGYTLGGVASQLRKTLSFTVAALTDATLTATLKSTTPAAVKQSQNFDMVVTATATKNDATALTKIEVLDGTQVIGTVSNPVSGTAADIVCTSVTGFAAASKSYTVKLTYNFDNTTGKTLTKSISVSASALTQPSLVATLEALTPATVKVGQAFTFDSANNVTVGDATNVKLDVYESDKTTHIAGPVSVASNNSHLVIPVSHAAFTTDGLKQFCVKMTYDLGSSVGLVVEKIISMSVAALVEPTLAAAMANITPDKLEAGCQMTYDMQCTVAKNDADSLDSIVVEDDTAALVGTETFNSTSIIDGLNTIACTQNAARIAGEYSVKVTLNYTLNGAAKTKVQTVKYTIAAKTLNTMGFVGKGAKIDLNGIPGSSGSDTVAKYLTEDVIKACVTRGTLKTVDPFVDITETKKGGAGLTVIYLWPSHFNVDFSIKDALGSELNPLKSGVIDTVTPFSVTVDGNDYYGFCTSMQDAPLDFVIKVL